MTSNQRNITAACPTCGERSSLASDNAWRPFCSRRCKLIDLGDWFDERNAITSEDQSLPSDPDQ